MISCRPWIYFFFLMSFSFCGAESTPHGPTQTPTPLSPVQCKDHHSARTSDLGHVRLAFVGDINLGRRVKGLLKRKGERWVSEACKPILDDADLVVANLESPVGEGGKKYTKKSVYLKG